jgi:hypothetical protein
MKAITSMRQRLARIHRGSYGTNVIHEGTSVTALRLLRDVSCLQVTSLMEAVVTSGKRPIVGTHVEGILLCVGMHGLNQSINVTPVAMKLKKLMPAIH